MSAIEVRESTICARIQLITPDVRGIKSSAAVQRAVGICAPARFRSIVDGLRECVRGGELQPARKPPVQAYLEGMIGGLRIRPVQQEESRTHSLQRRAQRRIVN